jgi:pyruvate formate lyase activating enzyme
MSAWGRCIRCGKCLQSCGQDAIRVQGGDYIIDYKKCSQCGRCAEVCYAESKKMIGREVTVNEVIDEIIKDRRFFDKTGGGVTFTGGEPLLQPEFLTALCKACKAEKISTAIETCGYADFEKFKSALPFVDLIFFDVKHLDPEKHRKITGEENELILENLKKIDQSGVKIVIRTPVVPGLTDDRQCIEDIARLCLDLQNVTEYELLAYHNLGESKYRSLGRAYPGKSIGKLEDEKIWELVDCANHILEGSGKKCTSGIEKGERDENICI